MIPQLITSTLEAAINKLSSLDSTFDQRSQVLLGRRLLVKVKELKVPLTFVVSEQQIHVLSKTPEETGEPVDCSIITSLSALKELKDPNQITRLIKD